MCYKNAFARHCEQILQKFAWQSMNLTQIYLWIATNLHAYALQILAMTKIPCHTDLSLSYFAISCHFELSLESEVSINLKCDFSALRYILNSWIFRYAQNDNALPFLQVDFFCCGYALQAALLLSSKNSKQQKHISLRLHLIKPFVSKASGRVVFIAGFAVVAPCQSLVSAFVVFAKCETSLA